MATILGSCGCCGDGGNCGSVKANCNVALRQYMISNDISVAYTTNEQSIIDCWENRNSQPCQGIGFTSSFSVCDGEGMVSYMFFNQDGSTSGQTFDLGTAKRSYQDESIDWDKIEVKELTELEEQGNPNRCKFSYKFNFDPMTNAEYYVISVPCDDTIGYQNITLNSTGKVTFYGVYNSKSKTCLITPA